VHEDHTDDPVAALWSEYKQHHTSDARERLILHYSPLVKFVAGRVASGLPQSVEQADLVSYGIFGLIDAIEKFDPSQGFKFETYARARVKGGSSTRCGPSTGCRGRCGRRRAPSSRSTR